MTNGEFDCVIKCGERYNFYECKYFDRPMTVDECRKEREQLENIKGIEVSGVGFICTGRFPFDSIDGIDLIDGDKLYFVK